MNRILIAIAIFLYAVSLQAHPMGNFSINHYSAFSIYKEEIRVHYIIDLAEIPTFQAISEIDVNGDKKINPYEAGKYAGRQSELFQENLKLQINGLDLPLNRIHYEAEVLPGAGGLPTLLLSADYSAPL